MANAAAAVRPSRNQKKKSHIKESLGSCIFDVVDVIVILILMLIVLVPLVHVLWASFSKPALYAAHEGLLLWPEGFSLESYKAVFRNRNILTGYGVTIFVVVIGTTLSICLTAIAGYVLSRKDVMWNHLITVLIVFSMYFNGGMIPFFLVVKGVGLNGSIWSLIIPTAVDTYNLIIMRTAMAGVPAELVESAKLDGANDWTVLWKIMVPLVKATIAVLVLFYAVYNWNAWFNAMLFIHDKAKEPLQLILREVLIQNDTSSMTAGSDTDAYLISETIQYATIVVATVPILAVYPFIQKYFVKGVMVGAVKG